MDLILSKDKYYLVNNKRTIYFRYSSTFPVVYNKYDVEDLIQNKFAIDMLLDSSGIILEKCTFFADPAEEIIYKGLTSGGLLHRIRQEMLNSKGR